MSRTRKLVSFSLFLVLYGVWPGRVCGEPPSPIVVTGVVTSGSPGDRLGEEYVGLYGRKPPQGGRPQGGRLDTDKTLGLEVPNDRQGPWGVYCLTSLNIDEALPELWVLADNDVKAAHPKLARLGGPDQHGIRRVRVGDLVVNLIDDNRLRGDIETSADRIAAVIETEAVRSFFGVYGEDPQKTANGHVLMRAKSIAVNAGDLESLFEAVPKYFEVDIKERPALRALSNSLLSDFQTRMLMTS
jgi:hypothetical protein